MTTMQEALIDAGLAKRQRTRQTLAADPAAKARQNLPAKLARQGICNGPISDFVDLLDAGSEVFLVQERGSVQVRAIEPQEGTPFARVWLGDEEEPRRFRLALKVRYVIAPGSRR